MEFNHIIEETIKSIHFQQQKHKKRNAILVDYYERHTVSPESFENFTNLLKDLEAFCECISIKNQLQFTATIF